MDTTHWVYAATLLLVLTACGGGSSSSDAADPETTNRAPSITSDGSVSVSENTTLVLDVSATDPDGDTLSFALAGEDAALFGISEDGQLSFDTAPDFEVPSDSDGDNVYSLTVTASDGTVDTSLDVTAEVINDEEDDFQLTASQFTTGNDIPLIHACAALGGNNFSPQVSWRNAPDNTDSFALIIDDETAPCGTDANACVHWNLFNIDASIEGLIEDVDPTTLVDANGANSAVEGLTYAGTHNYEGPCPPAGNEHTYHFALYALSEDQPTMTRLDALTRSEFEEAYSGNILGQANLTGTFTD
ncbi:MAG: YbhB/YbcL family Raf kinase inhibitor-like protein [Proteobacteria bacterium]|nr:YbhB/YbcL family Raf kinase inhibitor-like protein [Pseudomonadota bacterium]